PRGLGHALASAAQRLGAEVRTGAEVLRIISSGGRAIGVALAGGEEIRAPIVVSGLDPKRTLLVLVDPVPLGPTLVWRAGNLRLPGVVGQVNMALAGLPRFAGGGGGAPAPPGGPVLRAPGVDSLGDASDASLCGRGAGEPSS